MQKEGGRREQMRGRTMFIIERKFVWKMHDTTVYKKMMNVTNNI